MRNYSEFGYGIDQVVYSQDKLDQNTLFLPEEIMDVLLYHNFVASQLLKDDKNNVEVTYKVGLLTESKNIKLQHDDGIPFYLFKKNGKVLDNTLVLHIKEFNNDKNRVSIKDSFMDPIICSFEGLVQALETLGYNLSGLEFENIEEYVTSSDDTTLNVRHNKNSVRVKRDVR